MGKYKFPVAWSEQDVIFDMSLLKPGTNTVKLVLPAGSLQAWIVYDDLRLERE